MNMTDGDDFDCKFTEWQDGFKKCSDFFLANKEVNLTQYEGDDIMDVKSTGALGMSPKQYSKQISQAQDLIDDEEFDSQFAEWQDQIKKVSNFLLVDKEVTLTPNDREDIADMKSSDILDLAPEKYRKQVFKGQVHKGPSDVLDKKNRAPLQSLSGRDGRKGRNKSERKKTNAVNSKGIPETASLKSCQQGSNGQVFNGSSELVDKDFSAAQSRSRRNKRKSQKDSVKDNSIIVSEQGHSTKLLSPTVKECSKNVSPDESREGSSALLDEKISAVFQSRSRRFGMKSQKDSGDHMFDMTSHSSHLTTPKYKDFAVNFKEKDDYLEQAMTNLELLMEKLQVSEAEVKRLTHANQTLCEQTKRDTEKYVQTVEEKDKHIEILCQRVQSLEQKIDKVQLCMQQTQHKSEAILEEKEKVIEGLKENLEKCLNQNRNTISTNEYLTKKVDSLERTIQEQEKERLKRLNEHDQQIAVLNRQIVKLTDDIQERIEAQKSETSMLGKQNSRTESLANENSITLMDLEDIGEHGLQHCQKCKKSDRVDLGIQTESPVFQSLSNRSSIHSTGRIIDNEFASTRTLKTNDYEWAKSESESYCSQPFGFECFRNNLLRCADLVDKMKCEIRKRTDRSV